MENIPRKRRRNKNDGEDESDDSDDEVVDLASDSGDTQKMEESQDPEEESKQKEKQLRWIHREDKFPVLPDPKKGKSPTVRRTVIMHEKPSPENKDGVTRTLLKHRATQKDAELNQMLEDVVPENMTLDDYIHSERWGNCKKTDKKENVDSTTCPVVIISDSVDKRIFIRTRQKKEDRKFFLYQLKTEMETKLPLLNSKSELGIQLGEIIESGLLEMLQKHVEIAENKRYILRASAKIHLDEYIQSEMDARAIAGYNVQQIVRDLMSIGQCFCCPEHSDGVACEWGGASSRLALLLAEAELGKKGKMMQEGLTLGGTGHGSLYNTRVIYMPTLKDATELPLNSPDFVHYEKYMCDYIDYCISNNIALPTTKARHDSAIGCGEILSFIHEARSGNFDEEETKVLVGLCRILSYSDTAYGCISEDDKITWYMAHLNGQHIHMYSSATPLLDRIEDTEEHERVRTYKKRMIEIIKHIAGIACEAEEKVVEAVDTATKVASLDHPGMGKIKFEPRGVRDFDGIFCMSPKFKEILKAADSCYYEKVFKPGSEKVAKVKKAKNEIPNPDTN